MHRKINDTQSGQKTHFRQWKAKKSWLYGCTALALLAGAAVVSVSLPQVVSAASLPAGASQVGTINNAPVIKSPTANMGDDNFKSIVTKLTEGIGTPSYVVNQVSWTGSSSLVGGKDISSFGKSTTYVFGQDGYLPTDKGVLLNAGGQALIKSVGSAIDTKTGKQVPLDLGIRFTGAKNPTGDPLNQAVLAAKSQGGVITLGFNAPTYVGDMTGGETEGGGTTGGTSDGSGSYFINEVTYQVVLLNAQTGQPLPNDTLMPIKMSDIDASQLATMGGDGTKGYVLAPNSALSQSGNGFKSASSNATNADTTQLSPSSYLVLKLWNTNTVQYQYMDGKNDHMDIVTGIFGNTPWDLSNLLGGYIQIDKTTDQYGDALPNKNYDFTDLAFDVVDASGKVVDTIKLDASGKGKSKRVPTGKYTLRETSGNWKATGQTVKANDSVTVNAGETENVTEKNTAVTGELTIKKQGEESGTTMWNKNYTLAGNQFVVTGSDGKQHQVTTDATGTAKITGLPLDTYKVEEVGASKGFVKTFAAKTVALTYKDQNTKVVFGEADGTNQEVTGEITVKKQGVESGAKVWNGNYTLAGNKFTATSSDGKKYEAISDATGVAKFSHLPLETYKIEESAASPGFINTFASKSVTLSYKDEKTAVILGETSGTNQEVKGQNTLEKSDKETGTQKHGKADMTTAKYEFFHADDSTGSSPHKAGDPVKWSEKPAPKLLAGTKATSAIIDGKKVDFGDNVVIDVSDDKLEAALGNLSAGKYYAKEVDAGVGYVVDPDQHAFEITKKDDKTANIVTPNTKSAEQIIKAKLSIQKLAEIVGESAESGHNGVEFTATPLSGTEGKPVTFKTGINQATNEDGYGEVTLDFGDYLVQETKGIEGYDKIRDIYIHMEQDTKKDLITISASNHKDFSTPFSIRTFSLSDNSTAENPNGDDAGSVGVVDAKNPFVSLSKLTFTDKVTPTKDTPPVKDVTKTDNGASINHGNVALASNFVYELSSSKMTDDRNKEATDWSIEDDYDETYDQYDGTFKAYAQTDFASYKTGDQLPADFFKVEDKDGKLKIQATQKFIDLINENKNDTVSWKFDADFFRPKGAEKVYNKFIETKNGVKQNSNEVDTHTPTPAPHKFDLFGHQVDLTNDKLLNDDDEMKDRYKETNADPYNDKTDNNEAENINTKRVEAGDILTYQLDLDTKPYDNTSELTTLQMVDDYDEAKFAANEKSVKVYDKAGKDVTSNFKSEFKDGKLTVSANVFKEVTNSKGDKVKVVDTQKVPFGQDYKIEFDGQVKDTVKAKEDIINTAKQVTIDSNSNQLSLPTEKRVNPVRPHVTPSKDVTKVDNGASINTKEVALSSDFIYVLNSTEHNAYRGDTTAWTIDDDFDEAHDSYNSSFKAYATTDFGSFKAGDTLPDNFFVAKEGSGHVIFTAQQAFLDVVNQTKGQRVGFSIHASFNRFKDSDKVVNTFDETLNHQKEHSNTVYTNTPAPLPHKFDLFGDKVDLTNDKVLDDDSELKDRYKDTNKDPYVDKTDNNEAENINTKPVEAKDIIDYQLDLDTKPYDDTSELTALQMVDHYDAAHEDVDVKSVKVYNKAGEDVTSRFNSTLSDGRLVVSANLFKDVTNASGEKVKIVDTKEIPFGQDYKIEFKATVKDSVKAKEDIINTAQQATSDSQHRQLVHETEKRVNPVRKPVGPSKDVTKVDNGKSINTKEVALASDFVYVLNSSLDHAYRTVTTDWSIDDDFDETHDAYIGQFKVYATTDFGKYKVGDELPSDSFKAEEKDGHVIFTAQKAFLALVDQNEGQRVGFSIHASFNRFKDSDKVVNTFDETLNGEKAHSNEVNTHTPAPLPHKFDLSAPKVDLTNDKLLDDDKEMKDRYADSNKDPYADKTNNNEKENLNTKEVQVGQTLYYQLDLDATPFDQTSELTQLSMVDDYDEKAVTPDLEATKVYDKDGKDVTKYFKITDKDGQLHIAANVFKDGLNNEAKKVSMIDTSKLTLGQYYKIDAPMKVKEGVKSGYDILNTAKQEWTNGQDQSFSHITEKRVNKVVAHAMPVPPAPSIFTPVQELYLPKTGFKAENYIAWFGTAAIIGSISIGAVYAYRKRKNKLEPLDL